MAVTALYAALLGSILLSIAVIDAGVQRIPNGWNLALLGSGIAFQLHLAAGQLGVQLLFGAGLFLFLFLVRSVHRSVTGTIGLGLGDVKMAGAGALWFSPASFSLFLLVASSSALAFALATGTAGPAAAGRRVPFGPFLGLGIATAFVVENLA